MQPVLIQEEVFQEWADQYQALFTQNQNLENRIQNLQESLAYRHNELTHTNNRIANLEYINSEHECRNHDLQNDLASYQEKLEMIENEKKELVKQNEDFSIENLRCLELFYGERRLNLIGWYQFFEGQ